MRKKTISTTSRVRFGSNEARKKNSNSNRIRFLLLLSVEVEVESFSRSRFPVPLTCIISQMRCPTKRLQREKRNFKVKFNVCVRQKKKKVDNKRQWKKRDEPSFHDSSRFTLAIIVKRDREMPPIFAQTCLSLFSFLRLSLSSTLPRQ